MASTFHGEGGKDSIKLVDHQNAVGFCFLTFISWNIQFSQIPPFLCQAYSPKDLQAVVWGLPALSLTFPLRLKNPTKMVFVGLKFKLGNKEQKGFKVLSPCVLCC